MKRQRLGLDCKTYMAKEMKERLTRSPHLFITSFTAMAVPEQEELRRKLEESQASLFVVKNRIVKKVLKEVDLEPLEPLLQGMTAIALAGERTIEVCKTLVSFADKNETFKIMGGYCFDQVLDENSVKQLAAIPSRETLISQILSGFQTPIQGLVNTFSATIKGIVVVLNRISEKK